MVMPPMPQGPKAMSVIDAQHGTNRSDRLLVRVSTAAQMLDISKSTLYALIGQGKIPVVRLGKSLRISVAWLQQWISEQPIETAATKCVSEPNAKQQ